MILNDEPSPEADIVHSTRVTYEGSQVKVSLHKVHGLQWNIEAGSDKLITVNIRDIIGATLNTKHHEVLFVHTCLLASNKKRERQTYWFVCETEESAQQWIRIIRATLSDVPVNTVDQLPQKKYAVLYDMYKDVNETWQEFVKPMLDVSNIETKLFELNHHGHAKELASNEIDDTWDAVVCIGGDSLVSDVINGWMSRPDWSRTVQTPIVVVPIETGPGYLLASSIGVYDAVTATYMAIKGVPYAMDVFSVLQGSSVRLGSSSVLSANKPRYGFFNIYWGVEKLEFNADNSIERSFLFAWNAVKNFVASKRFTGRVMLHPSASWTKHICGSKCTVCVGPQGVRAANSAHENTHSTANSWKEAPIEATEILQDLAKSPIRSKTTVARRNSDQDMKVTKQEPDEEEEINLDEESNVNTSYGKFDITTENEMPSENGPSLSLWKGEDPFFVADYEQWKVLEPEFAFFLASKSWTLGAETAVTPYAHMSDGYIDIIAVRKASNTTVARVLNGLQNGVHVKDPAVEYFKVKGFKVEPTSAGQIIVDGEALNPYGPVRVEVHKGLARLMCQGFVVPSLSIPVDAKK